MSKDLFSRYIWIVDTIKRYGRITREELNDRWSRSQFSVRGEGIPRRTFYNYRQAIEDLFKIDIECDPATFEYYIDDGDQHNESVTDWLLNSAAMNNVLSDSRAISSRIFLEDVPSARRYLSVVISALKEQRQLDFNYSPYTRSSSRPVTLEPYFLKIFRQRWYITGRNVDEDKLKTYALDRMDQVTLATAFTMPEDFDAEEFCADTFGIMFTQGDAKRVVLRTDPRQAKYFRTLPLHHSQQEMVHDQYSDFSYRLKLTPDFVQELLGYGPRVMVMEPPELRAMIVSSLRDTLNAYGPK